MQTSIATYKIEVWYRYYCCGELEKDFDIHEVQAFSLKEAIQVVQKKYQKTLKMIFQMYYNNQKISKYEQQTAYCAKTA